MIITYICTNVAPASWPNGPRTIPVQCTDSVSRDRVGTAAGTHRVHVRLYCGSQCETHVDASFKPQCSHAAVMNCTFGMPYGHRQKVPTVLPCRECRCQQQNRAGSVGTDVGADRCRPAPTGTDKCRPGLSGPTVARRGTPRAARLCRYQICSSGIFRSRYALRVRYNTATQQGAASQKDALHTPTQDDSSLEQSHVL
jgi:hypothetical protein